MGCSQGCTRSCNSGEEIFDLLTRLEGADLNYSELQKKTKLLALLPESWSSLIINLNRDLPRLSLEDVKRAILQEDFRRRELASADGAGAASVGRGYGEEEAEDEGEEYLVAATSVEAAGVGVVTAATTRATGAVAANSMANVTIASNSLKDGPLLKAKRVEEQEEGEAEAVEAVAVAEVEPRT
ncbi:unnamed protein product [Closterium sp. Yama58-4]|nr:unnamed protein product [Closterium sp. Yama58-4]